MRSKLSTAIGFSILTVLLMAGAAQSLAGTNTVTSDDIVDGTIITPDLKNNALSGSKILDNAVTGTDVNEATLVLTCATVAPPIGPLVRAADVCYGNADPDPTDLTVALQNCAAAKLRLPTYAEARLVTDHIGGEVKEVLWTQDVFDDADGAGSTAYRAITTQGNSWDSAAETSTDPLNRCVTTVGARP